MSAYMRLYEIAHKTKNALWNTLVFMHALFVCDLNLYCRTFFSFFPGNLALSFICTWCGRRAMSLE